MPSRVRIGPNLRRCVNVAALVSCQSPLPQLTMDLATVTPGADRLAAPAAPIRPLPPLPVRLMSFVRPMRGLDLHVSRGPHC
jgi:hypothetical protein